MNRVMQEKNRKVKKYDAKAVRDRGLSESMFMYYVRPDLRPKTYIAAGR